METPIAFEQERHLHLLGRSLECLAISGKISTRTLFNEEFLCGLHSWVDEYGELSLGCRGFVSSGIGMRANEAEETRDGKCY